MEAPRLRRGLFGYSGKSTRLVVADRELRMLRLEERIRDCEEHAIRIEREVGRTGELEHEARALLDDLEKRTARLLEAEDTLEKREELHDLLRAEIAAARRDFLNAHERASSAEAKLREIGVEHPSGVIVLPDLDGAGANGDRRRTAARA
ncbi:MAG: hypothetical protein AB1551_00455 [Actinomycetota bacterium]